MNRAQPTVHRSFSLFLPSPKKQKRPSDLAWDTWETRSADELTEVEEANLQK